MLLGFGLIYEIVTWDGSAGHLFVLGDFSRQQIEKMPDHNDEPDTVFVNQTVRFRFTNHFSYFIYLLDAGWRLNS